MTRQYAIGVTDAGTAERLIRMNGHALLYVNRSDAERLAEANCKRGRAARVIQIDEHTREEWKLYEE